MFVARRWKTPKAVLGLFTIEFLLTIAALALFGIADPNTYRTRLWQDGADNGFNSNPNEILYSYANHRPMKVPLVWSQFITTFNVVISVLSMFILLVKVIMYVMHTFIPVLSVFVHALLLALYAYSTYVQSSSDMSDPDHPSKGAPWYLRKSCNVVSNPDNKGYCEQAKGAFAVTTIMMCLFVAYFLLSVWSTVPSKDEKAARAADEEAAKIPEYSPETTTADDNAWAKQMQLPKSPMTPRVLDPRTPRTVAFQTLEGAPSSSRSPQSTSSSGPSRTLPFREHYSGPDGR